MTFLWVGISLLAACSLVNDKNPKTRENGLEQKKTLPAVRTSQMRLSFLQENGEFSSGFVRELESGENAHFSSRTPIVIPDPIPTELKLAIDISGLDSRHVRGVEVNGQIGEADGPVTVLESEFVVQNPESHQAQGIQIHVRNFNQLFIDLAENHAYLNLNLRGEGSSLGVVRVPVMTPPSALRVSQMTVAHFEATQSAIADENKIYRSLDHTLSLIQVIQLRNPFQHTIVANFPLQPRGSLKTRIREVILNQQPCAYTTTERAFDQELSREFYLIPIQPQMTLGFRDFVNHALPTGRFDLNVAPGEEKRVGIYAVGEPASQLMRNARAQRMTTVQAVSSCRSRCGDPRTGYFHWDINQQAASHWESRGWPGESSTCHRLRGTTRIFAEASHPDESAMNRCALWELSNGTSPWDERRFCQSMRPGNPWNYPIGEHWNVQRQSVNVLAGTESGSVRLQLTQESTGVNLRYLLGDGSETTPARPMDHLIQLNTVQLQ